MSALTEPQDFAGRAMIVTGGSQGIGRAVAELAAQRGASLVLVGRRPEPLDETVRAIVAAGGQALAVTGDVADARTAAAAVAAALDGYGRLDAVANIAGAFPTSLLADTSDQHYGEAIAANLTGTFMVCRAALPTLREQGGAIVNMSSTAARLATPGLAVYAAAKAGIEGFTRTIAVEAAPHVRVNAVSAGPTLTDTVRSLVETDTTGAVETVTKALPLGRMAEPREIAEAVLFLLSDRASIITGQVLHANAGGVMA